MSTPVVTDTWAGNLDCSTCDRKRLMADQFSKRAMDLYIKTNKPLSCLQCVAAAAAAERSKASATTISNHPGNENTGDESRVCAACHKDLAATAYNKNQWNKGEAVSRCRDCVEAAIALEQKQQTALANEKRAAAQLAVDEAKKSGNAMAILKAESVLAALEAEKVTGLKPVKMNSGRGRGRSSGRNSGSGGRTVTGRGPGTAARGRR